MKINASKATYFFFFLLLISMIYSSLNLTTVTMALVSVVMFCTCAASSTHLFGKSATIKFIIASLVIGWFAEYMGARYGWFFGDYDYTDTLGFMVFGVPFVIPIMWFNLCYVGLLLSSLIIERAPFRKTASIPQLAGLAFLGATLVTAYDLAADPYMIQVVKAWIMEKPDGWWFGGTLMGFVGWMTVAFWILMTFLLSTRKQPWSLPRDFRLPHALIPVAMYFCWMMFQVTYGVPVETRTISAFAMGTPILIILLTLKDWKNFVK